MKDEIIDIALRQLRLGGYDNLSFAKIASELKTTRANLHHHFKNKEGLAEAAVKVYVEGEKRVFAEMVAAHEADLRGFLEAMEAHLIALVSSEAGGTACVASQLVRDSVAPDRLRQIALRQFRYEASEINRLVEGHFGTAAQGPSTASEASARIVATIHGFEMMSQIETDQSRIIAGIKGALTSII